MSANLFRKPQKDRFAALDTAKASAGIAAEQLGSANKLFKKYHYSYYNKKTVDGIDSWLVVESKPFFSANNAGYLR